MFGDLRKRAIETFRFYIRQIDFRLYDGQEAEKLMREEIDVAMSLSVGHPWMLMMDDPRGPWVKEIYEELISIKQEVYRNNNIASTLHPKIDFSYFKGRYKCFR